MDVIALLCAAVALSAAAERPVGKVAFCGERERKGIESFCSSNHGMRFDRPVTLYLVGDSTLSPRCAYKPNGSWGDALAPRLAPNVRIVNCAVGGRSIKSYRSHWTHDVVPCLRPGDWALFQFAANDAGKNRPDRSCTPAEYAENLRRYVAETRAAGANPLLVSCIGQRLFSAAGAWATNDDLRPYTAAMAAVAAELKVPYVNLTEPTRAATRAAGAEGSKALFTFDVDGRDSVLPSKAGAALFARCFLDELAKRPGHPANVLFTGLPPAPPGPDGWTFRQELATDPPPAYAAPSGRPWLENRISRCFFSPIKRPPFNRDELKDAIDYYPDNYLERLRREGVNGLWITVELRDLGEASLAKLRRTVERCAAHGVKVWAFGIEPKDRPHDDPFFLAHPDARGPLNWNGNYANCASSPALLAEIEGQMARLFRAVPGLAGFINIANGERTTTCLSFAVATNDETPVRCPVCMKRRPWELYRDVAAAMVKGMRAGNPEARLLTWFYQPSPSASRGDWVRDCARHVPDGAEMLYNFESGAVREQAGKTRHGGDYWLSFPGPAAPFASVAAASHEVGGRLAAKIQTSCSHECATVPYVPVPGLLYRKFKGMKEAGVRDVMMCWYFGNAPGLMNRAAGLLAYEDFADGEDAFLARLAKDEWGADAAEMGALWRKFSDAYSHYPLSNNIQYYGPFHAGFSWPLYPEIAMRSLQRTWKPLETPGGDLLGEALLDFTLEDALASAEAMVKELDGVRPVLARLRARFAGDRARRRDLGVMVALLDLFESARDIFRFYGLRRDAVFASRTRGDAAAARAAVAEMRRILARERELSREMVPLCDDDSRLGFHSEAEAHQFTSDYLRWRVGELDKAEAALGEIDAALAAGRPYPESARERGAETIDAEELADGSLVIAGTCPELTPGQGMELRVYDLCGTAAARVYAVKPEGGRYRVVLPASDWAHDARLRPAWAVLRQGRDYNNGGTTWARPDRPMFPEPRLNQHALTGDNFARLVIRTGGRAEHR